MVSWRRSEVASNHSCGIENPEFVRIPIVAHDVALLSSTFVSRWTQWTTKKLIGSFFVISLAYEGKFSSDCHVLVEMVNQLHSVETSCQNRHIRVSLSSILARTNNYFGAW